MGSRWMLWQILAALSKISSRPDEVEALMNQAHTILLPVAETIPQPDLRASFLAMPAAAQVIGRSW